MIHPLRGPQPTLLIERATEFDDLSPNQIVQSPRVIVQSFEAGTNKTKRKIVQDGDKDQPSPLISIEDQLRLSIVTEER